MSIQYNYNLFFKKSNSFFDIFLRNCNFMKIITVITEFNPFHFGHIYLKNKIKEEFPDSVLIAVMSGNTVQRGDFAIFDKYERAKAAVQNGFDIILELPFPFSCSAGEQFACAGVRICEAIGGEILAFGSESGDLTKLTHTAQNLCSSEFTEKLYLSQKSDRTVSAITAKENLYRSLYSEELPKKSNDILGIEYIRQLLSTNSSLTPFIVHRITNHSATSSREAIRFNDSAEIDRLIPEGAFDGLKAHPGLAGLSQLIIGKMRLEKDIICESSIINAIKNCAISATSFEDFLTSLPTKTYTLARLRREIIGYLLGVGDKEKNQRPEYTVLLAANQKGLDYLSKTRKTRTSPILTKLSDSKVLSDVGKKQLETAMLADSLYALGGNGDFAPTPLKTPYIEKNGLE